MRECEKNSKKRCCGKKCKTNKKSGKKFNKEIFSLAKKILDLKELKKNLMKKRK